MKKRTYSAINKTKRRLRPILKDINSVYTNDDYNSNDGMLTSIWGPGMWHYLHTMSFNYPVNPTNTDKTHYRDFLLSLRNVLPCGKCRTNLRANFKKLPLYKKYMKNRHTFSNYVFELHELINTMLGKVSGLTYEQVRERYEHFRARCTKSKTKKRVHFTNYTKKTAESGCVDSLYGEKSKCILQIVPQDTQCDTLSIDKECIKHRGDVVSTLKNNS
tara:strand:+ start:1038 stop:1688 length:651 start_codon:yes stop_codon:yes gene_type:complete